MMPRKGARDSGFTLVELMLVMAILGILTTLMWGSFSQAVRSKKKVESAQERIHTVRAALMRMTREIEMAYLSENNDASVQEQRTRFQGTSHPSIDELVFSSFAHQRLRADVAEADTSLISYYAEPDADDPHITNLMRRETRRIQAADPTTIAGEAYILCPDIARLKFSYWDQRKKEWTEEWKWNSPGVDRLPVHVHITLTVYDQDGRELRFSSDASIHMTEKVARR